MKILACSDIHGSVKALNIIKQKVKFSDMVICCGDFTIFGNGIEAILKIFNSFNKQVLLVAGNHEDHLNLENICKKYSNILYLHNKGVVINNIFFFGNNTNGFTYNDQVFENEIKHVIPILKKYKDKKKVLLTHSPPFGTRADLIIDRHCGNKSVRHFLIENKIDYSFCGHIHEAANTITQMQKTVVVNSGAYGVLVTI
ncbi:metallophosphoesterase [Candidatus Woesearchaeota archaeon]|nr:metallophosphoesterase [Candidatus Woesearchaeota archaeon]